MFKKTASAEVLGISSIGKPKSWKKKASGRISSVFMDGGLAVDIESALDTVADAYKISRNPEDYIFIPTRANSADRPNDNLDGFHHNELLRLNPYLARKVYQTYVLKPHFINHNSSNLGLSRGVIIDAHYNDDNPIDDNTKRAIFEHTGEDRSADEFVETLIAVDTTKDKRLAEAYKNGSVYRFSMGCDVEATMCSIPECKNVATNTWEFCDHIRNKFSKRVTSCNDGVARVAFEWCVGTVFSEESAVDDPADKTAEVQEGILKVANTSGLSLNEIFEINKFVAKNADMIPESVVKALNRISNS